MKTLSRIILTIFLAGSVIAQNGKIVEREKIDFPADTLAKMAKRAPAIPDIAQQIELTEITYFSDSLKVKGFVAKPRAGGNYPCVIVNRGGNREFGALSGKIALRWLGQIASWGYVVAASQYRGNAGGEGMEEFGGAGYAR